MSFSAEVSRSRLPFGKPDTAWTLIPCCCSPAPIPSEVLCPEQLPSLSAPLLSVGSGFPSLSKVFASESACLSTTVWVKIKTWKINKNMKCFYYWKQAAFCVFLRNQSFKKHVYVVLRKVQHIGAPGQARLEMALSDSMAMSPLQALSILRICSNSLSLLTTSPLLIPEMAAGVDVPQPYMLQTQHPSVCHWFTALYHSLNCAISFRTIAFLYTVSFPFTYV